MDGLEFFVQLPYSHRYGPYSCPEGRDIASDLLKLSEASDPSIAGTHFRAKLPKNLLEHILVVAYPLSGSSRPPFVCYGEEAAPADPAIVYGVKCSPNERMSEDEIRNRLKATNGDVDVIGERCLRVHRDPAPTDSLLSRKYGRGTIFVAERYDYSSDSYSPPTTGIPTNLHARFGNEKSHAPVTATSDRNESDKFVTFNQNLVIPGASVDDDTRKIQSAMDAPRQALVPDLPHLEQKSPLQNLGDLAGGTALQSVLVTPSGEQPAPALGGPLPCKDRPQTIIINITGEDGREEQEREKIVRPESESSSSVSAKSPNDGESLLSPSPYRRQRSLSGGEDAYIVAPRFQKSQKGMVTGRTLSLPPSDQQSQSESVEKLCTGFSSNLLRTQSDLSTFHHRNCSDSNLLLNCGTVHAPVDDRSNEQGQKMMRRRSMSDLGVQRQNSGGGLNEAVITGAEASKLINVKTTRPRLDSVIHERDLEDERKVGEHQRQQLIDVLTSSTDLPCAGASRCSESNELQEESRLPGGSPCFQIGSFSRSNSREDAGASGDDDKEGVNAEHEIREAPGFERRELVERDEDEAMKRSELGSQCLSSLSAVGQQVHIMEHVYNGKCVLEETCPVLAMAEGLRQMSGIVEAHRNGVDSATTGWLKDLIRMHCSTCRDSSCRVPHMAVGCPPPGMVQSSSSSSGSPIRSRSQSSPLSSSSQLPPSLSDRIHCQPQGIGSVSIDSGRKSTSAEVRDYYRYDTHAPTVCGESGYPLEHRGANYPDNPHVRPCSGFDGGFPIAQGTPPDEDNPMVVIPNGTCYGRGRLLGEQVGCGFAPVAATNNEDQYQPMGFATGMPHNPIQQATDFDITGVPSRHQTCYIQPSRKVQLRDHYHGDLSPSELPDVREKGFPHSTQYSKTDEGVLIYCSERLSDITGFVLGTQCCSPNQHKSDILGRGGNGQVYSYFQNGEIFALKRTTYRPTELQAWFRLDHPNVLPLLGVMWGGSHGNSCYQLMPKMTSDLSSVMRSVGDLCTLVGHESRVQWENVVRPNVCHVVKGLVSGVKYLHDQGVQHYDLKASNILIRKSDSCLCTDIFNCECPLASKCEIRIADFDSVKVFTPGRCAALVPDIPSEPKPLDVKVLGTPFYRAPEQFKQHSTEALKSQQLQGDRGLEGPWCDLWAVGVIVTQLCLGKERSKERERVVQTLVTSRTTHPSSALPTPDIEGLVALERLSTLRERCINCYQLAPLADIAASCLEPDFKRRITAERLLRNHFFL